MMCKKKSLLVVGALNMKLKSKYKTTTKTKLTVS